MGIKIKRDICNGCQNCLSVCKVGGLKIIDNKAQLTGDCNTCGDCIEACLVGAIEIEIKEVVTSKLNNFASKGVWIIGEQHKNKLNNITFQLVGKGRELANKLGSKLTATILGAELEEELNKLSQYGVDDIIYIKSPILINYYPEFFVKIISNLILDYKPEIVLIPATPIGRDFAPRISKRLNTGLTADCTELEIESETRTLLLQTRPTWRGKVMAVIKTPNSRPQMTTVRPGMYKVPPKINKDVNIRKILMNLNPNDAKIKILNIINREKKQVNLEDAEIIVAGGRGVGSRENWKIIEELAAILNAEIAGSRVAVELGWIDQGQQVGQTGKGVSPKLYIACGISGAIQHRVGIQNSGTIVAINKDPNAPIFEIAHYGIVGDLHKIIPALIEEIKRIKSEAKLKN